MKTVIIYASIHHGNTKKIAEAIAQAISADLIDITKCDRIDITAYDTIGLASGIYYHSFHRKIKAFIVENTFAPNQSIFTVATCGIGYKNYASEIEKMLKEKQVPYGGHFQCRGFDTFGILGKIGGIAKNHPNTTDIEKAIAFALHTIDCK